MMDRSTAPATTPATAVAFAAAIADARRGALVAELEPWIEEARALVALAPAVRALVRRALTVVSPPPPPVGTSTGGAPSLDALVQDPAGALALSHETRTALLVRAAGALAALAATPNGHRDGPSAPDSVDRLLTPAEAATALGVTVTWLYRHSQRLPFARRLSRKALRFSEAGLRRWQAARRP